MALQFTVLASGSGGNASLLEVDGFGVLIDAGLGIRDLTARLAEVGASPQSVHAILLTHTHSDHWRDSSLAYFRRRGVPLYCHPGHHGALREYGAAFAGLREAGLVRDYEAGSEWRIAPGLACRAFALSHDCGQTFGFRLTGSQDLFGQRLSVGYAADLGCWAPELAGELADVDILALEFNHDVELEVNSGRAPYLVARILGEKGHLSNEQAACLLAEVLRQSEPDRLQHVVQLHLSRDCNRVGLAVRAARAVLDRQAPRVQLHTANQYRPGPILALGLASSTPRRRTNGRTTRPRGSQRR